MTTTTKRIEDEMARNWGAPAEYHVSDADFSYVPAVRVALRDISGAANWYPECNEALRAIAASGDVEALTEWRNSDAFEEVAEETCSEAIHHDNEDYSWGDCQSCKDYVGAVRDAFDELISAIQSRSR